MAEELSEDRQRLIFRYVQEATRAEPAEPLHRPALEAFALVEAPPARLNLLRWRSVALVHRHPQLRLALVLLVVAVSIGWLVARA